MATAFKEKSLLLPLPLEDPGTCAHCGKALDQPTWRTYGCPRKCGLKGCTLRCIRAHGDVCVRKWWHVPKFGDRFAGHNFPLSKAAGLKGIETQLPLDLQIQGDGWDFKTEPGKQRLEDMEADGDLMWTHWAPERHTCSKQRGKGFWNDRREWEPGQMAFRSRDHPEGLNNLRRPDLVTVRQANAMAKRAVKGLLEANRRGRFASLEHPGHRTSGTCRRWNFSTEETGTGPPLRFAATVEKERSGSRSQLRLAPRSPAQAHVRRAYRAGVGVRLHRPRESR